MQQAASCYDILIKNALLFDGSGSAPQIEDLAIADGRIAARGPNLPTDNATEVVDAKGLWLMPGLLDIHTHLDLEVEVNPGLGEAVRHGTTTVVVGNCSLGTAFGPQLRNGESPVIDCFTRVENMPKRVLQKCVDKMHWDNTADYLKHFNEMPLGPNIAPLIPHSMLRTEVMGVEASVSRKATPQERQQMAKLLDEALEQGYVGMSTDGIIFHYLANEPHKDKRIPTQFSEQAELAELISLLRKKERVWQTTPDSEKMGTTVKRLFWTSGRLFKKPLRVSALTALDFKANPGLWRAMLKLAALLNSRLLKGKFHFQALSTSFRMWSNGIHTPVFEELESTRALIACEIEDREGRLRLINDPQWQQQFRDDWQRVSLKSGWRKLFRSRTATFILDAETIYLDQDGALTRWSGRSLQEIFSHFREVKAGRKAAYDDQEQQFIDNAASCDTVPDFFIECLKAFDLDFRWWMDVANLDKDITKQILFDKNTLPGFNDSGAHITNLAFYDGNLLTLKLAQEDGLERVAHAVRRLTSEPAEFFGIDAGKLCSGARADVVLINPDQLKQYDSNANRQMVYHEQFEQKVLVNRSNGVVNQVYINGTRAWDGGCEFTPALGKQTLGTALTCQR